MTTPEVGTSIDAAGIAHRDLQYGNYLGPWRRRNALKLWTGWPTFPMVFVKGVLVGGYTDLKALSDSGEMKKLVGTPSRKSRARR